MMFSFRTIRRMELIKMLSIKRFQKLLIGYFATAGFIILLYMAFHGNEPVQESRAASDDVRYGDDQPLLVELNGSEGYPDRNDDLLRQVDQLIQAQNNVDRMQQASDADAKLLSENELQNMIDAFQQAPPAGPPSDGGNDVIDEMSTVTPDYFQRSIAYTKDYEDPEGRKVTKNPQDVNNDNNPHYYELDKLGAAYDDVELLDDEDNDEFEIPHILHQTWDTVDVPSEIRNWVLSWMRFNPFWTHWFWTEHGFMDMLLRHFPEYYDIYRKYEHKVNKADMRKYFLLYKEGGVVADLDLECFKFVDDAIMDLECVLAEEPIVHSELIYGGNFQYITPAFMACRPEHPFLKFVIDNLRTYAERSHAMPWNDQVLNSTGTMFLSQVYHDYKRLYGGHDVYVAPAELFMPAFDPAFETQLRVKCNGYRLDTTLTTQQKNICEGLTLTNFENFRTENSYTWHHWSKSWIQDHTEVDSVHILGIEPDITVFDR